MSLHVENMETAGRPDLRSETDRAPGQYKSPADLGEYRNFYRRADGSIRIGCAWRDAATAQTMREIDDGEFFVTCRNTQFDDVSAPVASLAPETTEA